MKSCTVPAILSGGVFFLCLIGVVRAQNTTQPAWGKAVRGLQAGLVIGADPSGPSLIDLLRGDRPASSPIRVLEGQTVQAEIAVRNVSDRAITLVKAGGQFSTPIVLRQQAEERTTDPNSEDHGSPFRDRHVLEPGETTYFSVMPFYHTSKQTKPRRPSSRVQIDVETDESFKVAYEILFDGGAAGWSGNLRSGAVDFVAIKFPTSLTKLFGAPKRRPPVPPGKRTVHWGEPQHGMQAGILFQGTHAKDSVDLTYGKRFHAKIVIRNVGEEPISFFQQSVSVKGHWTLETEHGFRLETLRPGAAIWQVRPGVTTETITLKPGREKILYSEGLLMIETDAVLRYSAVDPIQTPRGLRKIQYAFYTHKKNGLFFELKTASIAVRLVEPKHRLLGRRCENFQLSLSGDRTFELADSRDQEVIMLLILPYRESDQCVPLLARIQAACADRGVRVFGVSYTKQDEVRRAMEKYNAPFELAQDPSRTLGQIFQTPGVTSPRIVIIGKDGRFRFVENYQRSFDYLHTAIESLL